jgi:fatty acid desaturase
MTTAASSARRDYSLTGPSGQAAIAAGLASAEWYHPDIPRKEMKELMQRHDGPALRDTAIWLALLVGSGAGIIAFWGSWWVVPFVVVYGAMYGSAADSRWHETGHGTAFRTPWMNDAVYQLASFMMLREPTVWRWSHARHHTDTIIVGLDPEIGVMRPPNIMAIALEFLALRSVPRAVKNAVLHARGRLTPGEATFVPDAERYKIYRTARIWLAIFALVIVACIATGSILPAMLVGPLPSMYGTGFQQYFGLTQHTGLAEDVLDHRLNSRTVHMNPVFRFIYWNMNYHVEHHMFPMVPYHALPRLHARLLGDLPKPYASTIEAFREIIPTLIRQRRDPSYFVRRELPATAQPFRPDLHGDEALP